MLQSGAEVEHKRAARWWLVLHQYLELEDALETQQPAPRALTARPTSKGIPEGQFFARGTAMGIYFLWRVCLSKPEGTIAMAVPLAKN